MDLGFSSIMYITASKIFDLPVASLESKSKIGQVSNLFFSPDELVLVALEVKTGGFLFSKKLYLSSHDIIDFDKNGLVISSDGVLVESSEIVRIKEIIKAKISVYGQKAVTKSNKYLGKIFDLLIDSETCGITKFYISNLLQERILDRNKVEKVTPKAVIFSDEVIEQIPLAEAEGAAA